MNPNTAGEPVHEFARAIAFANMPLPSQRELPLLVRQDLQATPLPGVCAYAPFVDEIGRALRLPGRVPPREVRGDLVSWFSVFRPAYGFARLGDLWATQRELTDILSGIHAGDAGPLVTAANNLSLRLGVETLTLREPMQRRRGRGRAGRARMQRINVGVSYAPVPGRDGLVYGIALGGARGYFNRMARCTTCDRFILGKTDRPAHYCDTAQCRSPAEPPTGEAPSRDAGYQRRRRARLARWYEFERGELDAAIHGIQGATTARSQRAAAGKLEEVLLAADQLIEECFPRKAGEARVGAIAALAVAKELLAKTCP